MEMIYCSIHQMSRLWFLRAALESVLISEEHLSDLSAFLRSCVEIISDHCLFTVTIDTCVPTALKRAVRFYI